MNVLFVDFEGILKALNNLIKKENNEELIYINIEKGIAILAEICKEYDCKVVITSASKGAIDEETMKIDEDAKQIQKLFELFKKYEIDCIGRTPYVKKWTTKDSYYPTWKEDEIRLYLIRHPEINHYCIIDVDNNKSMVHSNTSDLDKVRDHLVKPLMYSKDYISNLTQLENHKEEIGKVLKKTNKIQQLVLKRRKN